MKIQARYYNLVIIGLGLAVVCATWNNRQSEIAKLKRERRVLIKAIKSALASVGYGW